MRRCTSDNDCTAFISVPTVTYSYPKNSTGSEARALMLLPACLLSLCVQSLQSSACLTSWEVLQLIVVGCNINQPLSLDLSHCADVIPCREHKFLVQSPAQPHAEGEGSHASVPSNFSNCKALRGITLPQHYTWIRRSSQQHFGCHLWDVWLQLHICTQLVRGKGKPDAIWPVHVPLTDLLHCQSWAKVAEVMQQTLNHLTCSM